MTTVGATAVGVTAVRNNPNNQISLRFKVPHKKISLHLDVRDNQISLHLYEPTIALKETHCIMRCVLYLLCG